MGLCAEDSGSGGLYTSRAKFGPYLKTLSALLQLQLAVDVFLAEMGNDIKSSCLNVLMASGAEVSLENNDELMRWIAFGENFPCNSEACLKDLNELNEDLIQKSVLLDGGLQPSAADVVVFSAVYAIVVGLSDSDRDKVPHLMRWMDYIQSVVKFGELFERILIQKASFDPPLKAVAKGEAESSTKKTVQVTKDANSLEAVPSTKKSVDTLVFTFYLQCGFLNLTPFNLKNFKKKVTGDNKAVPEKKKLPEKVPDANDAEVSVSLLKIQIGLLRKAWKHPSADSLLVEEIDIGEPKVRQVVSGLAKFCSPEELMNRRVALITNVKPGKLRDVMSEGLVLLVSLLPFLQNYCLNGFVGKDIPVNEVYFLELLYSDGCGRFCRITIVDAQLVKHVTNGLASRCASGILGVRLEVLCASSEDHTAVEPLIVPEGARIGECVSFTGHEGKPEDVLNPKKKQLDKITPHLFTNDKGVATFKGIPFMTSGGPCTSSHPNGSIK
ncbi:hypothetical protein RJ639_009961 [Escallonia herrerae]|uniref:tRNA-binding domain-containing protein n=1 Tax=Escallonia herrerae TaxID=1293975 RepID=A0AA88W0D6_9ASTE|nr:hypothetical protein RJ639_009961 [Escallonia herrerae]